jgi:hypothetical protein
MSIDKVVDAFCKQVAAGDDDDENFVCTDINGVKHDLRPSSYHITSKREGPHYRVIFDEFREGTMAYDSDRGRLAACGRSRSTFDARPDRSRSR